MDIVNIFKNQYILIYSLFDSNNNRIFQSIEDADPIFLNNISNKISENIIEISTFRTIARSDIWKNYWSANNDVFDRASSSWTDEQKTLIVLTRMYDSAYQHPECSTR
jgi:hypothetical protein